MCLTYLRLFLVKLYFCVPARVAINIKKGVIDSFKHYDELMIDDELIEFYKDERYEIFQSIHDIEPDRVSSSQARFSNRNDNPAMKRSIDGRRLN